MAFQGIQNLFSRQARKERDLRGSQESSRERLEEAGEGADPAEIDAAEPQAAPPPESQRLQLLQLHEKVSQKLEGYLRASQQGTGESAEAEAEHLLEHLAHQEDSFSQENLHRLRHLSQTARTLMGAAREGSPARADAGGPERRGQDPAATQGGLPRTAWSQDLEAQTRAVLQARAEPRPAEERRQEPAPKAQPRPAEERRQEPAPKAQPRPAEERRQEPAPKAQPRPAEERRQEPAPRAQPRPAEERRQEPAPRAQPRPAEERPALDPFRSPARQGWSQLPGPRADLPPAQEAPEPRRPDPTLPAAEPEPAPGAPPAASGESGPTTRPSPQRPASNPVQADTNRASSPAPAQGSQAEPREADLGALGGAPRPRLGPPGRELLPPTLRREPLPPPLRPSPQDGQDPIRPNLTSQAASPTDLPRVSERIRAELPRALAPGGSRDPEADARQEPQAEDGDPPTLGGLSTRPLGSPRPARPPAGPRVPPPRPERGPVGRIEGWLPEERPGEEGRPPRGARPSAPRPLPLDPDQGLGATGIGAPASSPTPGSSSVHPPRRPSTQGLPQAPSDSARPQPPTDQTRPGFLDGGSWRRRWDLLQRSPWRADPLPEAEGAEPTAGLRERLPGAPSQTGPESLAQGPDLLSNPRPKPGPGGSLPLPVGLPRPGTTGHRPPAPPRPSQLGGKPSLINQGIAPASDPPGAPARPGTSRPHGSQLPAPGPGRPSGPAPSPSSGAGPSPPGPDPRLQAQELARRVSQAVEASQRDLQAHPGHPGAGPAPAGLGAALAGEVREVLQGPNRLEESPRGGRAASPDARRVGPGRPSTAHLPVYTPLQDLLLGRKGTHDRAPIQPIQMALSGSVGALDPARPESSPPRQGTDGTPPAHPSAREPRPGPGRLHPSLTRPQATEAPLALSQRVDHASEAHPLFGAMVTSLTGGPEPPRWDRQGATLSKGETQASRAGQEAPTVTRIEGDAEQGSGSGAGQGGGGQGEADQGGGREQGSSRRGQGSTPPDPGSRPGPGGARSGLEATRGASRQALLQLQMGQTEQPVNRGRQELLLRQATSSIPALLKRLYRDEEYTGLDRDRAVNGLLLVLKMGGDQTYHQAARALELSLELADELDITDPTVRSQVELGALLRDIGEMEVLFQGEGEDRIEALASFMSSEEVRQAGLLHDIGQIQLPPEILQPARPLTEAEYEQFRMHPILGEQILYPIASLRHLCPVVRGHHERWDGRGFPDGLRGERIPLAARVLALTDAWQVLTSPRPDQPASSREEVRELLRAGEGTHFDPRCLEAFFRVLDRRFPELLGRRRRAASRSAPEAR